MESLVHPNPRLGTLGPGLIATLARTCPRGRARAVNAQLVGSGLEAEAAQWSWLDEPVGMHRGRTPLAPGGRRPTAASRD
jgi:hypothetical protein